MHYLFYKITKDKSFLHRDLFSFKSAFNNKDNLLEIASYKTDQDNRYLVLRCAAEPTEEEIQRADATAIRFIDYEKVTGKEEEFNDVKFKRIEGRYKYWYYPKVHEELEQ